MQRMQRHPGIDLCGRGANLPELPGSAGAPAPARSEAREAHEQLRTRDAESINCGSSCSPPLA